MTDLTNLSLRTSPLSVLMLSNYYNTVSYYIFEIYVTLPCALMHESQPINTHNNNNKLDYNK